jgi:GTP-binding protein EngB required for normal cell division
MTGLNDNHKRRILTSLQYADKLLEESLHALAPGARPLFSGYLQDLSPAESRQVASYAVKIREQMSRLMHKCGIEISSPGTFATGKLRTCLTSLDLTLEDIHPEKMRGYGKMDSASTRDLSWTLQEIRRLVSLLLVFLSETRAAQAQAPANGEADPALAALIGRFAKIIENHGLVEFLPALSTLGQQVHSSRYEIAVFGRANAGKTSLINRLLETDLLPVGITPIAPVPIRVAAGPVPLFRVSFADRIEEVPVTRLAEFASERENPANAKHVVALELSVAAGRLREGFAFLDMPDTGCFTAGWNQLSHAGLPDSDLGFVLVDGQASVGREHLDLLRALDAVHIRSMVIITKCDLLSQKDLDQVLERTRSVIAEHLRFTPEVIPFSSIPARTAAAHAWFEQAVLPLRERSRVALLGALGLRAQSLRASLLATLDRKATSGPRGAVLSPESERILRRLDENMAACHRRWEEKCAGISGWTGKILEQAAAILARGSAGTDPPADFSSDLAAEAIISAIVSHYLPFLQEYEDLASRIRAGVDELENGDPAAGVVVQELPKLSSLPAPLSSLLNGVRISPPGPAARANPAAATRYFRKELEEKLGSPLRRVLEELKPRFAHWVQTSMNALYESLRLQTDPLRYRSPSQAGTDVDGSLMADIEFLQSQT